MREVAVGQAGVLEGYDRLVVRGRALYQFCLVQEPQRPLLARRTQRIQHHQRSRSRQPPHVAVLAGRAQTSIEQQRSHLVEVSLKRDLFGAFCLYLSLYPSTLILELLLARLLLSREPEPDGGERERDDEELQQVPGRLITETCKPPHPAPQGRAHLRFLLLFRGVDVLAYRHLHYDDSWR